MDRVDSPLRYPGSKARLVHLLAALLERNLLVGSHIYEPFAGGAAASLNLIANGFVRSATWVERDPLIYAFWRCVKDDPEALITRMNRGKVTLAAWKKMQGLRSVDEVDASLIPALGYAGLFFNRTCFSGVVGAGPIGGMSQSSAYKVGCRFNKSRLAKAIRSVSKILERVEINFGDGTQFLEDNCLRLMGHSFVYIDPPYVSNGHKLYRYSFGKNDHSRLADVVSSLRVPWLVSYDNVELIWDLYRDQQASFVRAYQTLKGARFVNELLILSPDLKLPEDGSLDKDPDTDSNFGELCEGVQLPLG